MNNFVPLLLYLLLLSVRSIFAKKTEKKSFSFAVLVLSQLLREGKQAATFYTRRALFSAALCLIFLFRNFQQYIIRNLQREGKKEGLIYPLLFSKKTAARERKLESFSRTTAVNVLICVVSRSSIDWQQSRHNRIILWRCFLSSAFSSKIRRFLSKMTTPLALCLHSRCPKVTSFGCCCNLYSARIFRQISS